MKQIALICILTVFFTLFCSAQVTIGTEIKPVEGAILDLKQEDSKGGAANSKRGLGLPRVILISLTIPDGETSLSTTIDQASGEWNPENHIGLVVYNVKPEGEIEICPVDPIVEKMISIGPYVWDGDEWKFLGMSQGSLVEENIVEILLDERDGNKYPYSAFGNPNDPDNFAGYWTLENARYLNEDVRIFTLGDLDHPTTSRYLYPNFDPENISDTPPATWRPNQGLLYTYAAATLGAQNEIWGGSGSQGQEAGDTETTPIIQGVCPQGWHIPTDREWNKLAKVIFNNPEKYSSYASWFGLNAEDINWNEDSEIEAVGQGVVDAEKGLGIAMISPCSPLLINSNGEIDRDISEGKSKSSLFGGFNALLTGHVNTMADAISYNLYNEAAAFWTSSANVDEEGAWGRGIGVSEPQALLRTAGSPSGFSSVRCIKD